MTGAAAAAWEWAAGTAWQASLLALLVAVADRVLSRRGRPHLRHALWLIILVKLVLPPTLTSPWSLAGALRAAGATTAAVPASTAAGYADSFVPAIALAAWALGTLAVASLAIVRSVRLRRALLAHSIAAPETLRIAFARAAATMAVRRAPRLVLSRAASGIALVGAFRPLVVVPARAPSRREAEHAFLHELAHHRRRDLIVALAATAVRCVFWWHPAAWVAAARLADLREQCCDADVAAALGDDASAYRETLLDAARRLVAGPQRPRASGVAWLGGRSGLAARLEALSHAHARRSGLHRAATAAAVVIAAACAVSMAALPARTPCAPAPGDDAANARDLLDDVLAGRRRASCYQTKYAALRLSAPAQAQPEGPHR